MPIRFELKRPNLPWQHLWGRSVFLGIRGGGTRRLQFLGPLLTPILATNKFGIVRQMEDVRASRVQGDGVPKIFGTLYMRAHGMRKINQILHGDQTVLEENFPRHLP